MKTLLAIALVLTTYTAGFAPNPVKAPPAQAPTVPMAPGVKNPGEKNLENPDVPHQGDHTYVIEGDGNSMVLVVPESPKTEADGSKSIVVIIESRFPLPESPKSHRMVGRARFKCAEGLLQMQKGYVLDDEGNVIGDKDAATTWEHIKQGTDSEVIADIVCANGHPKSEAHEKRPGTTEL